VSDTPNEQEAPEPEPEVEEEPGDRDDLGRAVEDGKDYLGRDVEAPPSDPA